MANFADLWEQEPTNKFGGLNEDMSGRLQAANEAWKAKTGRDLPITSGARSAEQGVKLWGERGSNPNLVAKPGTSLHEKGMAADISPEVPAAFLDQFGLHRPFGSKDPVHVEINPKSSYSPKQASVTVSGAPTSNNFADLWDNTPAAEAPTEKGQPKGFTQIAKAAQETNKPIADVGKGLASIADIALGAVPAVVGGATYAGARAFQKSPEEAQALAQKVSAPLESPIGKALGITEDPAYKQEAVRRAMDSIGQYIGESADTISKKTGIPKSDVENMINTLSFAAGEGFAATKGARAKLSEQFNKAFPEMEQAPKPSMAGVGAAETQKATVLKQAIETASPELSQALKTLDPKDIDIDVLNRRLKADSLPIPLKYTAGQATQDPVLISRELNARGKEPKLAEEFNQQNKILQENASAMKDRVAPDVFTESHVADSQGAIGNIEAKAKANAEATKQAYQDLKDAAGGQFPVDGRQFADNAINLLKAEDRLDYLPVNIQRKLNDYQTGKKEMNFNLFENLRTDLAAEIRKAQRAGDGNQAYVLGQVRGELEKLPMIGETAELKVLADKARGLAKADFDLERQNKIYSDVVNGKADTKNFISKNVINSTNKDFADTMALVADDPIARQHLASGTLDLIIKDSTDASGNFLTGKFAKHINNLDLNGKLVPLFGEEANTLMDIAEASRIVGARPKGSFVNESNTLVGAMAEHAKTVAEHGTNVAFKGLPVGTLGRKFLNKRAASKELEETLSPIGGVKLKDIGKE